MRSPGEPGRTAAAPKELTPSTAQPAPAGAGAVTPAPTPAGKAHGSRSRRGAGRGPPRLRTTPSHRPSESGRRQQHVTAASIQDGGRGQGPQAPRLSPSPGVLPLGPQARALDRWAGAGLPSWAGQGQSPCLQSLPAPPPSAFSIAKRPAAGAWSVLWSPRPLRWAAPTANGVQDVCGKAGWVEHPCHS